jgi:hypothetical protein
MVKMVSREPRFGLFNRSKVSQPVPPIERVSHSEPTAITSRPAAGLSLGRVSASLAAAWLAVLGWMTPLSAQEAKPATPPIAQTTPPAAEPAEEGLSVTALDKQLRTSGLKGRMHGVDPKSGLYVFTYTDPQNFFNSIHFSVITRNKAVQETLAGLKRHDAVTIKGRVKDLENPQPHIIAESIELRKKHESTEPVPAEKFEKTAKLPQDLQGKTEATFLVHAVVNDGQVLVLEYQDELVMMIVPDTQYSKDLWRGDRVKARFHLNARPKGPTHLVLNTQPGENKKPLEVVDYVVKRGDPNAERHQRPIVQEGALVLFPKSPQINRDIWAIEEKGPDGSSRYFTLVNFEVEGEQAKIDHQLRKWWDSSPKTIADGRNKLINRGVTIRASGTLNVEMPNQANAQLFLKADGLKLLDRPPAK